MNAPFDQNAQDRWDAMFNSTREFIRCRYREEGGVVGIGEVLEHLDEVFGKDAELTSDVGTVLDLCVELWADPNIHQVADGWIEFYWDGPGRRLPGGSQGLRARLLRRSDAEELR
jgi:hypothetical protein